MLLSIDSRAHGSHSSLYQSTHSVEHLVQGQRTGAKRQQQQHCAMGAMGKMTLLLGRRGIKHTVADAQSRALVRGIDVVGVL